MKVAENITTHGGGRGAKIGTEKRRRRRRRRRWDVSPSVGRSSSSKSEDSEHQALPLSLGLV